MGMATADVTTQAHPRVRTRRVIQKRTLVDFWLDLGLFVAFVVDMNVRFTVLSVHEWLGIALGVALVVHLVLHTEWVARITNRILSAPWRERLRWIVDLALFVTMTLCVATGVLISQRALAFIGGRDAFWRWLHVESATWTVYLTGLHIALTWRWVVNVVKRMGRRFANAGAS